MPKLLLPLLFASAVASESQLSLKDSPPPVPQMRAEAAPYLQIIGFQGRLEVPAQVLRKYRLKNGQYITPMTARVIIAEDLGYDYPPEMRIIIDGLERKERRP